MSGTQINSLGHGAQISQHMMAGATGNQQMNQIINCGDNCQISQNSHLAQNSLRTANTKICTRTSKVFDSTGNYLKSICAVHKGKRHADADNFCSSNGMDLLIFENSEVFAGVSAFIGEHYKGPKEWPHAWGLWVNGKRFSNNWFVYKNQQRREFSEALPLGSERRFPGDCLVVKRTQNNHEGRGYTCTKTYAFICEFENVL